MSRSPRILLAQCASLALVMLGACMLMCSNASAQESVPPEPAPEPAQEPAPPQSDSDAGIPPDTSDAGLPAPESPPAAPIPEGPALPEPGASSESLAPAQDAAPLPPEAPAMQEAAPVTKDAAPASPEVEAPIEVTVVGTSVAKTAGSAHVINSRQLERWEYDDPLAVLASAPGVYVRQEDGMGLRPNIGLRGVNPDRSKKVTLLEDGILFGPAPYSAPAAYYFPIITRMTQVKVIKGPAAISYGPQTYNDYENLTDICTLSSGCAQMDLDQQFDAGRARIYGVEAFAQHDISAGPVKLPVLVSYTLTRGQFLRSFTSNDPILGRVSKNDQMPYLPRHQARASLGVEHARAGGSAGVTYVGSMREEPGKGALASGLHTDTQVVIDATAQARISGPFVLYANVQNLFDSQFIVSRRPYGARPNAPRWVHVGVKAAF